jgi:hypothetical protein
MSKRLVVSFRGVVQPEPSSGDRYLARALALKMRAETLGATLCAWSAQTFSFDFDPGELEEAVALAALAFEQPADAELEPPLTRSPPEERFSAGIAEGEMSAVGAGGAFAVLSWGPALVAAVTLARDAHAGEVLLDLDLIAHRAAEIERFDGMHVDFGRRRLVRRSETSPPAPAPASSTSPTPRTPLPPPPAPALPTISRPPASAPGQGAVLLDGGRARRSPTFPPPPPQSSKKLAALTGSSSPPPPPVVIERAAPTSPRQRSDSQPPPSASAAAPESSRSLPGDVSTHFQAPKRRPPTFPEIGDAQTEPLAELAKRALLQGDIAAVERLTSQLREMGEHHELVERMTGLVALRRGATAEALRRLRDAAEAVREPSQQARARLAYGVALATAGRSESALLEALEALARARAASDAQGERACALFLARLSAAAGHPDAASAWAVIAAHRAE